MCGNGNGDVNDDPGSSTGYTVWVAYLQNICKINNPNVTVWQYLGTMLGKYSQVKVKKNY